MSIESLIYAVCDPSNATDIDIHETRNKVRTACVELFTTQRIYENEADISRKMEIHTSIGTGYVVCEDCYHAEWEQRREANKHEEAAENA